MKALACLVLLLGAGCAYHPAPQTNTNSASYHANLASCQDGATASVDKENAKRAFTWFAAPVRRWGEIGRATAACMQGKGYGRLRWCTAEELQRGSRTGNLVVTPDGIQCTDKPHPPVT